MPPISPSFTPTYPSSEEGRDRHGRREQADYQQCDPNIVRSTAAHDEQHDKGRDYHRDWASRVFQPLLAGMPRSSRERRLTAVVIATDVLVWKLLRLDMQLSRPHAEATVVEMIESYSTRSS